jgi:hypothetical protein
VSARRTVIQAEALAWMDANPARDDVSVVTSLPDVSELPLDLVAWRAWFVGAVARVVRWVPAAGIAVFYQSDVRVDVSSRRNRHATRHAATPIARLHGINPASGSTSGPGRCAGARDVRLTAIMWE